MEYMYNGLQLKGRNLQDDQKIRLLIYYIHLQTLVSEKKEHDERYGKNQLINIFWDKESKWEQKIYGGLKEWDRRHPITGIVLCTVLGGILVSMAAGVLLEVILIYV